MCGVYARVRRKFSFPGSRGGCFRMTDEGMHPKQRAERAQRRFRHTDHEWHTEGVCAVSQASSATRIWHLVSKSEERGRMPHKMEERENGKVS